MPNSNLNGYVVLKFILVQLFRIILLLSSVALLREKVWIPYGISILMLALSFFPENKLPTFKLWQRIVVFLLLFLLMLVVI